MCALTTGAGKPPGPLAHTFPNLPTKQAFYDGLATRYFPDPADDRSSLQYSGLVHTRVCGTSDQRATA